MSDPTAVDVVTFAPPLHELELNRDLVLLALGYQPGEAPDMIVELVSEVLPLLPLHVSLRCGYAMFPTGAVDIAESTVHCGKVAFETGPLITAQLKHSESVAFYVSSAGPKLEEWSGELMAGGDMMRGYIVDAIGSELVEQTSVWLEKQIVDRMELRGWKTTNRYSPGYCDWPVSEQ
ncbi:MAG TPA: hypothetical protein VMH23_16420, partial [Bacteroidota bacterium]|nr:hypothetical protein [Bacteroidota bacterium]